MENTTSVWQENEKKYVEDLIRQNKIDKAGAALYALIELAANQKRFSEADNLRKWLIDINPMALNLVIRSAEIIEEAKRADINKDHLDIWQRLIGSLSLEEFTALYHNMLSKRYDKNELIANQGEFLRALFFINHGYIQLFSDNEGKMIALKKVGPGEIVGGDNFFNPSVWTVSARSAGAEVLALPYKRLQQLEENHPGLESKLQDYCRQFQLPTAHLKASKRGRRKFIRKNINGQTTIELLNKEGGGTGKGSRGELDDISKGGVSCSLHISQKSNAYKLFGRKIRTFFSVGAQAKKINRSGVVVAVRRQEFVQNEFSLHVRFDKLLGDMEMQQILLASSPG